MEIVTLKSTEIITKYSTTPHNERIICRTKTQHRRRKKRHYIILQKN